MMNPAIAQTTVNPPMSESNNVSGNPEPPALPGPARGVTGACPLSTRKTTTPENIANPIMSEKTSTCVARKAAAGSI
jgi:hypothetical protein